MSNRDTYEQAIALFQFHYHYLPEDPTYPYNSKGAWAKHYQLWNLPNDFQYLPPNAQALLYGMANEGHTDLLSQIKPNNISLDEFQQMILDNCSKSAALETESPVRVASADASASTTPATPVSASATAGAAKQHGWPCRPEGALEGVDLSKVGAQLADMAEGVVTPLVEKAVATVNAGFRRAA